MNTSTTNPAYNPEFNQKMFNNKYAKKKEIKIIDLRKNEHFGDILMILNEKSPVAVKVKTKKAELFFLQKTEATEISNRYSNIWKRIVNRSLHNMKEIKNLIRKKVFLFMETHNIEINPELIKKYQRKEQTNIENFTNSIKDKIKNSENIQTIIEEEDESINRSQSEKSEKNINQSTKDKRQSVLTRETNKNIKGNIIQMSIQKENAISNNNKESKNNEKFQENNYIKNKSFTKANRPNSEKNETKLTLKNVKKNKSLKEKKQIVEIKNNINGVNDMINIIDKEVKKSSKTNQINNFNINIYTPKVQFPLNQINIENQNSIKYSNYKKDDFDDSYNLGKINSEISYNNDFIANNIKDTDIMMVNSDENNNLFYSNIKLMDKKTIKNSNVTDNYNSNIKKLFENRKNEKITSKNNKNEKIEIKTNDKISIRSVSSDKSKIKLQNQNDIKVGKNHIFLRLDTSQSNSFTINSSYDNINQISKFKYCKNSDLREKTKNFILNQINDEKVDDALNNNNLKNNNNLLDANYIKKLTPRKHLKKKQDDAEEQINITRNNNLNSIKKSLLKSHQNRFDSQINMKSLTKNPEVHFAHGVGEKQKSGKKFFSLIDEDKKRNNTKKKVKKHGSSENEKTFYNKIKTKKTMQKRKENNPSPEEKSDMEHTSNKMDYDILISKNIQKNQQNLNNPEEYFEGFFNDIIFQKNKNNNKPEENGIKRKKSFNG